MEKNKRKSMKQITGTVVSLTPDEFGIVKINRLGTGFFNRFDGLKIKVSGAVGKYSKIKANIVEKNEEGIYFLDNIELL